MSPCTQTRTEYLVDPDNQTGYSQVLQETEFNHLTSAETKRVVYTIGLDHISQTTYLNGLSTGTTRHFGTDGHGSVRGLYTSAAGFAESGTSDIKVLLYDAYGNLLNRNEANAGTTILYSGESFDFRIGQQYLRARWYDPPTARFNSLDPFFGNLNDPQSLHKYAYVHGDPIQGVDPSGMFNVTLSLAHLSIATFVWGALTTVYAGGGMFNHSIGDKELVPDGILLSIGAGFAGGGLVVYGQPQVYVQFRPFNVYFYFSTELGISPLARFSKNVGGKSILGIRAVFDSDGPDDLAGLATNAYYPWVLARMIARATRNGGVFSWLLPNWWSGAMLTLQRYNLAAKGIRSNSQLRITNTPGSFEVSRGIPGATSVAFARTDITFASTLSYTFGPLSISEVGNYIGGREGFNAVNERLELIRRTIGQHASTITDPNSWIQIFQHLRSLGLQAE